MVMPADQTYSNPKEEDYNYYFPLFSNIFPLGFTKNFRLDIKKRMGRVKLIQRLYPKSFLYRKV